MSTSQIARLHWQHSLNPLFQTHRICTKYNCQHNYELTGCMKVGAQGKRDFHHGVICRFSGIMYGDSFCQMCTGVFNRLGHALG